MGDTEMRQNYYNAPCRVQYSIAGGRTRTSMGGYGLIERMRSQCRLIAAWSTSTGKSIA